jgi:hypothetical protein
MGVFREGIAPPIVRSDVGRRAKRTRRKERSDYRNRHVAQIELANGFAV